MERTSERVKVVGDVITGIAYRSKSKFYGVSVDDLIQELWLTVISREEKEQWEFPLDLVARVCYNRIAELQKYYSYRNTYSLDQMMENTDVDADSSYGSHETGTDYISGSKFEDVVMINDLLNKFEKDSREGTYIRFWMTATNVKDCGVTPPMSRENSGYTEDNLAKILGYAGSSSSGYRGFRWKMQQMIADYFGKSLD